MAGVSNPKIQSAITMVTLITLLALGSVKAQSQDNTPVADAGSSRYAGPDPVKLDGTGSFDPDNSGPLSYAWRQISGPAVVITDANTATPSIGGSMVPSSRRDPTLKLGGFTQTDAIQKCEFELVVSNGELTSLPDIVTVIIVPDFGINLLELKNDSFDPQKPTLIYFGGGDCTYGTVQYSACPLTSPRWLDKANVISSPKGYGPDPGDGSRAYYRFGDMILVYLSAVAPNYKQPIQTSGWSTGGQPAIDVGRYLNVTYGDRRYAINRVTFFDATPFCRDYSESIAAFLDSSVDGEQCWVDNYISTPGYGDYSYFYDNILNIWFDKATDDSIGGMARHRHAQEWYNNSLTKDNMLEFNSGIVAGAYWSVIGPGKNLQLASTPAAQTYKFQWYGWNPSGYMDFYNETNHPGRLPEPVTLVGPTNGAVVDAIGAVLSCQESENTVGYQLLLGPDPYHMVYLFSDTPSPPSDTLTSFPFEQTWWTIKAYDRYGSTIYADPLFINAESTQTQKIENPVTGQNYSSIQQAINDAHMGDEIVLSPGIYQYLENINFKGKNLTLRSIDPNDSDVVAKTILNGGHQGPAINLSGSPSASCVLAGMTIIGGTVGIACHDAMPIIRNCVIGSDGSSAIEFWYDYEPTIIDCNILGYVIKVNTPEL
jgi:hypothetical protein